MWDHMEIIVYLCGDQMGIILHMPKQRSGRERARSSLGDSGLLPLHFLLQCAQRLIYIVVSYGYFHSKTISSRVRFPTL